MPPPAPLIRAALPASCIPASPDASEHHRAAIHRDGLAGYETACVGDEPHDGADKILRHQIALNCLPGLYRVQRAVELVAKKFARSFGDYRTRRQRIDTDAVAPDFARQTAGKTDYGRLRRRVMQPIGHAVSGGKRGDIDDAAPACLAHRRNGRLTAVPD